MFWFNDRGEQISERRNGLARALHVSEEAAVLDAPVFHHVAQSGQSLRAQAAFRQWQREQSFRFRAARLRKRGSRVERGEVLGGEIHHFIGQPAEFAFRKFERSHGRRNLNTTTWYWVSRTCPVRPAEDSVFLSVLCGQRFYPLPLALRRTPLR